MRPNTRHKQSQRARQEYNSLPTKVSLKDFNRHIKPHLSVGTRGPRTKLSTYQIFNYILYVLHTGMQWDQLKTPVRWSNIYRHHNHWSQDGSYEQLFESSVEWLADNELLDLFALHGDGSNAVAKKGATGLATPATSTRKARNHSR